MFQAVHYDRNPSSPTAWTYFVRDDKKNIQNFKYYPPVYKLDEEGEFETLFGDRCSLVKGKYDRTDPTILEKDISKELAVLRDLYYKTDDIPTFHNILILDIEMEIIGPLNPFTIREANAEMTSIALIDCTTKEKICLIVDKESKLEKVNKDGKIIIPCSSEIDLIKKFLNQWENIDPTIVIGFNSDFYDIPYLYYRIKKLLGDEVYRLSPIGIIEENLQTPESPIKIGLVNCLDYMLLLKKYLMKEEPSYKLGDIGTKYAKLGKIEYDGNLDKLFQEDIDKFIDYNIRDVEIIEKLEEKQKFIELTILISHLCGTPYESVYYNTILNEGAILKYLKRKNIISPNKPTTTNPSIKEINIEDHIVHQRGTPTIEGIVRDIKDNTVTIQTLAGSYLIRDVKTIKRKESYAGGFLLDPLVGVHNWLFDEDVTSYYPFSIISLNIGIESLIGRIVTENPTRNLWISYEELKEFDPSYPIKIEIINKYEYTLETKKTTPTKLLNYIDKNNITISANGVLYKNNVKSVAAEVLEDWFNKRKEFKNLMKKAYNDGDDAKGKLYETYQKSFKILLNSLYGAYAVNSWRYTDGHKICSSSITCTGQRLISESIKFINEEMEKELQ